MKACKTLLLENDEWFWKGLEEFCKSFDPNFETVNTNSRDYMERTDFIFVGLIVQPSVERLIVASAFEQTMFVPSIARNRNIGDQYWQLEHFTKLIEYAHIAREIMGLGGLTIEMNYHGIDFITDLKNNKWGENCKREIQRFVRQNPDNLTINVYDEYKFKYRLTEANVY